MGHLWLLTFPRLEWFAVGIRTRFIHIPERNLLIKCANAFERLFGDVLGVNFGLDRSVVDISRQGTQVLGHVFNIVDQRTVNLLEKVGSNLLLLVENLFLCLASKFYEMSVTV